MKRSTNVIVSNLSGDKILISTFYTSLFLLFGKKNWGKRAPPAPTLATALPHGDVLDNVIRPLLGVENKLNNFAVSL